MSIAEDFNIFWQRFPRKVGKLAAEKEYARARKRASAEDILLGIERYVRAKPAYADWCHPRTFLSQGRFLDEADAIPSPSQRPFSAHDVKEAAALRRAWGRCEHQPSCGTDFQMCVGKILRNWREKRGDAA